jgi:hypothetical protein
MSDELPSFFPFELAADELRKQEFERLADAVLPTLEALRSLTPAPFRAEIALMLERLGYLVHTDASAHDLVVTKDEPQIHRRLRQARRSHVPVRAQSAAKPRGSRPAALGFTAETDFALEGRRFELSVPPGLIVPACRDTLPFAFALAKRGGFRSAPPRGRPDGRVRSEFRAAQLVPGIRRLERLMYSFRLAASWFGRCTLVVVDCAK